MEMSKELIERFLACTTAEEIVELAKENEYELSIEDAELYLQEHAEGELADDELDNVAGGQEGCSKPKRAYDRVYYQNRDDVMFFFNIGEEVEAYPVGMKKHTKCCYVRRLAIDHNSNGYFDLYYLEKKSDGGTPFTNGFYARDSIENPHS